MKLRHKLLLYILAGALLILALAVLVYFVDASESHATYLPLVLDTGGELHEDPCPPPTMAPTACPGYFETGVCDPTPTPFVITIEPGG